MTTYPSHIWIGTFNDDAPEDYFADTCDPEDDDLPMNLFAREQGESWLDYDFVEISFADWRDARNPRSFIEGHSYSDSYVDEVVEMADRLEMERINVFVLASDEIFRFPKSVTGTGYRLEYLGVFNCSG